MDKVVFVIPMFNASDHIPELIESIKEQTNENWEAVLSELTCPITQSPVLDDKDEKIILLDNKIYSFGAISIWFHTKRTIPHNSIEMGSIKKDNLIDISEEIKAFIKEHEQALNDAAQAIAA